MLVFLVLFVMSWVCLHREPSPMLKGGRELSILYRHPFLLPANSAHQRRQHWGPSCKEGPGVTVLILLSTADFSRTLTTQHYHLLVFLVTCSNMFLNIVTKIPAFEFSFIYLSLVL